MKRHFTISALYQDAAVRICEDSEQSAVESAKRILGTGFVEVRHAWDCPGNIITCGIVPVRVVPSVPRIKEKS